VPVISEVLVRSLEIFCMRCSIALLGICLLAAPGYCQKSSSSPHVSFANPIVFPSEGPFPTGIASGDFNNDGIPDLIVGDNAASVASVALGNGDGTFGDWIGGCGTSDPSSVVAVGKFDGKNLDALANDIWGGYAALCLGDGTGEFPKTELFPVNVSNIVTSFASADFNRDGTDDLAFVTGLNGLGVGELYVYLSNGDGTFRGPLLRTATTNPVAVATGDFNNDGNQDIVILTDDNTDFGAYVAVLLGDGTGGFTSPIKFRIPKYHGNDIAWASALAVADFNGDHNLDVAVTFIRDSDRSSYVLILLGNGDGTLRKGATSHAGPDPMSVAVADFNGDGIPDLVVANDPCSPSCGNPGSISVLVGNGDGTFQPPQTFSVNGEFPQLTVADVNGDGKPDVVTANGDSRSITVLLNTTPWPEAKH